MNFLSNSLPDTVVVDGREFFVHTDFRFFTTIETILNDESLSDEERILYVLKTFYKDDIPKDITKAFEAFRVFYLGGEKPKKKENEKKNGEITIKEKPVLSYESDSIFIISAFLHDYGIDLTSIDYLHWWMFRAFLVSLSSENKICKIIDIRSKNPKDFKNKKEKTELLRLQALYAIPTNYSKVEQIANAGAAFAGGF